MYIIFFLYHVKFKSMFIFEGIDFFFLIELATNEKDLSSGRI
jgi:hypothetical protein